MIYTSFYLWGGIRPPVHLWESVTWGKQHTPYPLYLWMLICTLQMVEPAEKDAHPKLTSVVWKNKTQGPFQHISLSILPFYRQHLTHTLRWEKKGGQVLFNQTNAQVRTNHGLYPYPNTKPQEEIWICIFTIGWTLEKIGKIPCRMSEYPKGKWNLSFVLVQDQIPKEKLWPPLGSRLYLIPDYSPLYIIVRSQVKYRWSRHQSGPHSVTWTHGEDTSVVSFLCTPYPTPKQAKCVSFYFHFGPLWRCFLPSIVEN